MVGEGSETLIKAVKMEEDVDEAKVVHSSHIRGAELKHHRAFRKRLLLLQLARHREGGREQESRRKNKQAQKQTNKLRNKQPKSEPKKDGSEESAEGSARKNEREKKRIKKEKKMNQFKTLAL